MYPFDCFKADVVRWIFIRMFRLMGLLSLSANVEVAIIEIIMGNDSKLMYLRMVIFFTGLSFIQYHSL